MTDPARLPSDLEAELRELGRQIAVPAAPDLTAGVRRRLDRAGPPPARRPGLRRRGGSTRRPGGRRFGRPTGRRSWWPAIWPAGWPVTWRISWRISWRVAVPAALALLAVLALTPPGRAVVGHVFRFAGIELRQEPAPTRAPPTPASTAPPGGSPLLPGERVLPLDEARRQVSFPILVPAPLGAPDQVAVRDGGRVATLVYRRTPYGEVRVDEFDGRVDSLFFRKFVGMGDVSVVRVRGREALWAEHPHEVVYIRRDGVTDMASARLTTGNTLIWDAGRVAVRLEGRIGKGRAIAIAASITPR
jgi:hypothetical protein